MSDATLTITPPVEPEVALKPRRVETADQVHQRRLAGPGWSNDGDVLSARDIERDAVQRVHRFSSHLVRLPDVTH